MFFYLENIKKIINFKNNYIQNENLTKNDYLYFKSNTDNKKNN